ncbi:MAG: glycoside hydrolase family 2 protein [Flavobacteriaceae bacterium]
MRNLLSILALLIFFGCKLSEEKPIIQKLHTNWEFKSDHDSVWKSASVPGNIFSDLLEHKIIENPFILNNEEKVQWVSDSSWVYKTIFQLNKEILSKKHIELNFEGLDTRAKIYINGNYQLDTDNAFRNYTISLKDITIAKKNELKIEFQPANLINDGVTPFENRVYTRKAQFQYGWDWGPKLNTIGIWKDVYIKAYDILKIEDVYVKQLHLSDSLATISADISINAFENTQLFVDVLINNSKIATHSLDIEFDKKTYNILFGINNPKRWWPHNLGEPYLYDIKFIIRNKKEILDAISAKKGLRILELISEKDSIGESFYFKVNDVPVYAKGANYIPQNSFQNKVTDQHYKKLLNDAVDANMNMLRVWGGGIYENAIFYDLCDEKGILVWQDFMFACAMYPGDKEFLANVKAEAKHQVKRLRNHASIALWAGNNENAEGWKRWGWQNGRSEDEKKQIWNDYLAVFDTILPNMVEEFSTTSYWESSPKYGRGNPNYKTEGDAHDWWVWHDAYSFEHFEQNVPRFVSEFGFQSFPTAEVINYINQKDSIDIHTDAIKSHQKHSRGFQLIDEYMKRDYLVPTNDEDYVYVSQLLQAKGITMGIEAQRRAKPTTMGSLFWQLNDCWPSISWSSIDYFGNWKALHYKARKSFKNILISTEKTKYDYDTYIINDSLVDVKGTLQLKIIDFYGKEIWSNSEEIIVKANSSQKVYHIPQVDIYKAGYVYIIEFNKAKSLYYFAKPKDLKLPKGIIEKEIKKTKNGFSINLQSTVLQKDIFLSSKKKGHFSDNFFDLLPNEEITIEFKTDAKTLEDLKIKTLNSL